VKQYVLKIDEGIRYLDNIDLLKKLQFVKILQYLRQFWWLEFGNNLIDEKINIDSLCTQNHQDNSTVRELILLWSKFTSMMSGVVWISK